MARTAVPGGLLKANPRIAHKKGSPQAALFLYP